MASTKVDNNRGPFGSKRSRNDASRSEGDWTCLKCGNVNFGFRVVCNREKCSAPRPPVTPPAPFSPYNTPFYFGGVGAPPLPYGLSGRYGSPIPHSGMRYDYGVPASAHGPYGPMPTFPPGAYGDVTSASAGSLHFKMACNHEEISKCQLNYAGTNTHQMTLYARIERSMFCHKYYRLIGSSTITTPYGVYGGELEGMGQVWDFSCDLAIAMTWLKYWQQHNALVKQILVWG